MTAKDFVYSWRRTVNPKTASQYSYLFSGIKNADAIVAGKKPVSSLGIKVVGKYKLVITLERRISYFYKLMGFAVFFPQSEKAVTKYGSKYGTASKYMLYNGRAIQARWLDRVQPVLEDGQEPILLEQEERQARHHQVERTKDSINFLQLVPVKQAGLHCFGLFTNQAIEEPEGLHLNQGATFYLQFNIAKNKYLANANVRKALSLAVNRKGLPPLWAATTSQPTL